MSEQTPIARFTIRIESVENAVWQGLVETEDSAFRFENEMQLFIWLLKQYPALMPESPKTTYWQSALPED